MGLCMSYEDPNLPVQTNEAITKRKDLSEQEVVPYEFNNTGAHLPALAVSSPHAAEYSPLSSPKTDSESNRASPTAQRTAC